MRSDSRRAHAITPTDNAPDLPPNPSWRYSPPKVSRDGRTVAVDAMQLPMILEYYRLAGVPLVDPQKQGTPKR